MDGVTFIPEDDPDCSVKEDINGKCMYFAYASHAPLRPVDYVTDFEKGSDYTVLRNCTDEDPDYIPASPASTVEYPISNPTSPASTLKLDSDSNDGDEMIEDPDSDVNGK